MGTAVMEVMEVMVVTEVTEVTEDLVTGDLATVAILTVVMV